MGAREQWEREGKSRGWRGWVTRWVYSPIEWHFGCALLTQLGSQEMRDRVKVQLEVNGASGKRYRIDFAVPDLMLAIELDGEEWHDPATDIARQSDLEAVGWTFVRFTGSQVYWGAGKLANAVAEYMQGEVPLSWVRYTAGMV